MISPLRTAVALPLLLVAAACGGTGTGDAGLGSGDASAGGSSTGGAQSGKGGAAGQPGGGGKGGAAAGSGQGGAAASGGQGGAAAGSAGASGASTGGSGGVGGAAGASGSSSGGAAGSTGGGGTTAGGGGGGGGVAGAAGAGGSTGGGGTSGGAGVGGTGGAAGCSAATQLVYVFTTANEIWSFDPPNKKFTKVATPDCPPGSANSMAIDRDLVAWLNYIGGIYRFDLKTKKGCQASGINLPSGYSQVGMGFSTDAVGSTSETLYIDGIGGGGLAKVDLAAKSVIKLGNFANDPNLSGESAELTGTGDARLFGYFTTSPNVRVAELDKSNGNVLSDFELKGVSPPSDWAFSFWGGDFYLYASDGGNSHVVHYDPIKKTVDSAYVPDTGMTIIGAGVSTCAPTTKP